ncbi:MAG: sensor histidine kinase [Bacteroidetes bacterium]|nr:MAG: sensor histidine kinase [Bacteroidota bacterium]MBL1143636.1 sensor histidine kinase [Bacteroidota bacterium]NOG56438.1 hypothetical protein [Bacteroidota bacterium]
MSSKKLVSLFILSICFILIGYHLPDSIKENSKQFQLNQFQHKFLEKEAALNAELEKLKEQFELNQSLRINEDLLSLDKDENSSFYVIENNKLIFWTDENAAFELNQLSQENSLVKLGNGLYYKASIQNKTQLFVGLLLIQTDYPYQNKYLKNQLQADFNYELIESIRPPSEYGYSIENNAGEVVFDLQLKSIKSVYSSLSKLQALISLIGIVLLIAIIPKFFNSQLAKVFSLVLSLVLIRLLLFYFVPTSWSLLPIFQPDIYAFSRWMPTFGDFLLNVITAFYLAYQLNKHHQVLTQKWVLGLVLIASVALGNYTLVIIQDSIQNSTISFNLNNLFDLNYISFLSLFGFGLLLFSAITLLDLVVKSSQLHFKRIVLFGMTVLLSAVFAFIFQSAFTISLLSFWLMIPLLLLFVNQTKNRPTISILVLLICLSAISAFVINKASQNREAQKRNIIIHKLAEEKDPIAEYLFDNVQNEIRKDTIIQQLIQKSSIKNPSLDEYLRTKYFSGYWKKYSLLFTVCHPTDFLYINPTNRKVSCIEYYQNRIRYEGDLISSSNLFQLRNLAGRIDYIAQLELPTEGTSVNLFIEMSANMFNQNDGYPELLIDEKSKKDNIDIRNYSYAVYDQGNLILNSGDFNYSTVNKVSDLAENTMYQYESENHVHTVFQKNKNVTIVLSRKIENTYNFLTSLAYLLVIYSLLYVFLSLSLPSFPLRFKIMFNDFSSRIQFFLIASLLLALVLFGIGTTYYIKQQNQSKNFKSIAEKIRSVNIELENAIGGEEQLSDSINVFVNASLIKLSNVFYTDINIYDTKGILFASSRFEVFSKGLKSNRLNPVAYKMLIEDNKAECLLNEKIGEMEYLSAYLPFKNDNNEIIAYLNLPYFAKQGELEEEISSFLVSTINIYVAIFVLSLIVSVLLINQLSKPLLMIRKQLGRLKFGGKLELIEWNSDDEIGSLVKEYNRMIVELSDSADRLAQSEREGAWREMAKQVAHEIKNPLTPMKLSIQHLQMAYDRKSDDLDEKVKRTTRTLVEQIETLSNIASEFSSFAKMPEQKFEAIDLVKIIKTAVDLYSIRDGAIIELDIPIEQAFIKADRDQLIRVFNNLIKNSIQAKQKDLNIHIRISLLSSDTSYVVSIADNGIGVQPDQLERIFEPNFTTKTSGSGLGLAMSKNILENLKGKIEIDSTVEVGTTFKLTFPRG